MNRRFRLAGSLAVASAALTLALAAPAEAATALNTGHIDALDVDYESGVLSLDIKLYSPANDDASPTAYDLHALPASQTTVPSNPAYSFLGPVGSSVWILPQTQNANLLWPGWNTQGVPSGQLANNRVSLRMVSVSGPGSMSVYTVQLGSPTVLFNSGNGLPDSMNVNRNVHAHANWAFTAAGTYTVVFEATATTTGGVAKSSGLKTYTFVVGS